MPNIPKIIQINEKIIINNSIVFALRELKQSKISINLKDIKNYLFFFKIKNIFILLFFKYL